MLYISTSHLNKPDILLMTFTLNDCGNNFLVRDDVEETMVILQTYEQLLPLALRIWV